MSTFVTLHLEPFDASLLGPEVPVEDNGAEFLIVGEAPGEHEISALRPFVGRAGKFLDGALKTIGMKRKQFNIANVVPWRPPNNDLDQWFIKGEPNEAVQEGVTRLRDYIYRSKPRAILALGNTALWALTGKSGITNRRGSLYWYSTGVVDGPRPIVVPTLHPAYVLREPLVANLFARDLHRFQWAITDGAIQPGIHDREGDTTSAGELRTASPHEPVRELCLFPTQRDLHHGVERCLRASQFLAVDIETGAGKLQCVGFSPEPGYSICIPADTDERIEAITTLLASPVPKVFHNAPYDVAYLRHYNKAVIKGEIHDTLAMAQALHPELPRSLGVLTSLYTLQPYYKDLGTLWKQDNDYATYWRYNALDAACTVEIAGQLSERLRKHGLYSVYERTRRILPHAISMACRGIRYDAGRASELTARSERDSQRFQRILDGRAGGPINVNSHPQVTKLLYSTWALPERRNRETGGLTGNERAVLSLYPMVRSRPLRQGMRSLLELRGQRKLVSAFLRIPPSSDQRMRSSFNPSGTETGRWSASKFLITEGVNLQTVPQSWRSCFVADEGMVMWYADYSQIEARLVSYLAEDTRSIGIFESGGDIHRENAAIIFRKSVEAISKRERDIGKSVHALNYGVGAETLMDFINKRALETGVWIDLDMAKYVRNQYLSNFDRIVRWQELTWDEVQRTQSLTNPFGRRRIFLGPTVGQGADHTKKEALAFVPQSTVPDLLNEALLDIVEHPPAPQVEVLLNVHDALLGQGPKETMHEWLPRIQTSMVRPITMPTGTKITIPVDIQVGPSWGELQKWSSPQL